MCHPNIELLCVSSFAQMPQNGFMINFWLLSYVIAAHMTIFFYFLEDFITIFHNRPTKTKYIFDIKISISKSAKPICYCLSSWSISINMTNIFFGLQRFFLLYNKKLKCVKNVPDFLSLSLSLSLSLLNLIECTNTAQIYFKIFYEMAFFH